MTISETTKEKAAVKDKYVDGMYMPKWRETVSKKRNVKYVTRLSQVPELTDEERERLQKVSDFFMFRANSYYLSLIDWDDPDDPIRRIAVPDPDELEDIDSLLDACQESKITVVPGCEHKYARTALILSSRVCGALCRFCFRKRLFLSDNHEVSPDFEPALTYIRSHPEIDNVLLTGGDPFMLSTKKIANLLERIRDISHVKIIRFGTKLPAFNPYRFIDDNALLDLLESHNNESARIYIVAHFCNVKEITDVSKLAIRKILKRGIQMVNQTPLLTGINDSPDALAELFTKLAQVGVPPYYVFHCRPTRGNKHFRTSFIDGIDMVEKAKSRVSGLAKRLRYAGSHASGKIEILGYDKSSIYFKYHQSKDPKYYSQFFKLPRLSEPEYWWDDWMPDGESFTLETCPSVELGSGTM